MGAANEAANRDRADDEELASAVEPGADAARRADAAGTRPAALGAPPVHGADDLKDIAGIGPANEKQLRALGIYTFAQIGAWGPQEIAWVNSYLSFPGRIEREDWVGQARDLAAGKPPRPPRSSSRRLPAAAPTATEPQPGPTAQQLAAEETAIAARLAALPTAATAEQRADVAGTRPAAMAAPRAGSRDDLKIIRGIGPVNERKLHELGIFHFDQIGAWTRAEIRWVGYYLAFPGRIDREKWVEQAGDLAAGKPAGRVR